MERKIQLITNMLNNEKIELEDELEKLLNSSEPVGEVKNGIMDVLKKIASIDSTGKVWESYLNSIINNSAEKKQ